MKRYNLANNVTGWLVFLVAAVTYCLTVEPSASFWDCPEFITTAFKLEVGHPPGAPFFMLTGNFFSLFVSDPTHVALCVNTMSALLSALCILFLFWTVTHLARKLVCKDQQEPTALQTVLVMACGVCGALCYTWSDTFWFSAVEGEVYAYSSMFTALVFWLILKWENHADEPRSDRYLVLIFYLTGLSIGVHLLNLLCLPAITLVWYFKRNPKAQLKGSLAALGVSLVLVAAVLYGVVPGIVKVGGWFELFFTNQVGLPFNAGLIIYLCVLIGVVLSAIWSTTTQARLRTNVLYVLSVVLLGIPFVAGDGLWAIVLGLALTAVLAWALTRRHRVEGKPQYWVRKRFLNTSLLCMLMLMIGYSTYALIVVRSTANPPMDQNSPEDIFSLGTYLNREQYGDRPLLYGQAFTSEPAYQPKVTEQPDGEQSMVYEYISTWGEQIQRHEKKDPSEPDRYDRMPVRKGFVYPDGFKMLLPRMYAPSHKANYESWLGEINYRDVDATWTTPDGQELTASGQMPSQVDNIRFFLSYQVNYMYWRYFMWNFAGRQNDLQGHGDKDKGNWITGIPFLDNAMLGDQSLLPKNFTENKGHNVFFCLPLLLGLLGLFWQAYRGQRGIQQFWVVFFLFFMTGLAIVLYLNQGPSEPRERDYAYAGSFYAFAIWIGLGIAAAADLLRRLRLNERAALAVACVVALAVPLQMVSQTWDDHDRSGRYACRDFGQNYLNTMPEKGNPIIFTNGDNDTFPLWYALDTEGVRTDARVCNLSYLQTDWYTDQMRRPALKSPGLPIAWKRYEYVDNRGRGFDYFEVKNDGRAELDRLNGQNGQNTYDLRYIIDHYVRANIAQDKPGYLPTDSVVIHVNKQNILSQGIASAKEVAALPDYLPLSLSGRGMLTKSDLMMLEIVSRNDWQRPIYLAVTLGSDNLNGLSEYLQLEGLAYRLTPFRHDAREMAVDVRRMFDNMVSRFRYGGVNRPGVYLDETNMRMCQTHRNMFIVLADNLLRQGDKARALRALKKCKEVLPEQTVPYDDGDRSLVSLWQSAGQPREAERVCRAISTYCLRYLQWASTSPAMQASLSQCLRLIQCQYALLDNAPTPQAKQQAQQNLMLMEQLPAGQGAMQLLEQQQQTQQGLQLPSPADFEGGEGDGQLGL